MSKFFTLLILLIMFTAALLNAQGTLVARYTFDDGTANDNSGNNLDGILFGNPAGEPAILADGLRFDGINDYIEVPTSNLMSTERVSMAFWIYLDEIANEDQVLISKIQNNTGYQVWLDGATGVLKMGIWGSGGEQEQVSGLIPVFPRVWTSIVCSYDAENLSLYLHGKLVAELPLSAVDIVEDCPLYIASNGGDQFFRGMMDQVQIGKDGVSPELACVNALKLWDNDKSRCYDGYTDVGEALGLSDLPHRHFANAMVDIDQDGWLDIYYANGRGNPVLDPVPTGTCPDLDPPPAIIPENLNVLFMNNGDGTFSEDIAPQVGLDDPWNAMRNVFADYDNDGLRDMLSHNFLVSPLYKQVDEMVFEDVSESSNTNICLGNGTGASWVDLDKDGYLDLYVVEYSAGRTPEEHLNLMFLNNQDGTFTDITVAAGVDLPDNPMGIAFCDYDNDGHEDVFTTCSHEAPSRLYHNDGLVDGIPRFTDVAAEAGVALVGDAGRGFGVAWGDINNDGYFDMLFVRERDTRLFLNNGPDGDGLWTFSDISGLNGLDFDQELYKDGNFADLNNDGYLDLVMANGVGPNKIFLNYGELGWDEYGELAAIDTLPNSTGVQTTGIVPGDYDNDGDLDLLWLEHQLGDPNHLSRNETRGNNWIQFRLKGTLSNLDAVGARIAVTAALEPGGEPVTQWRDVIAGTGFFSDVPRIQTFGLGQGTGILSVSIRWPSGIVQEVVPPAINQRIDILEPDDIVGIDEASESTAAAESFMLEQNYPNPFNPSTSIRYALQRNSKVEIRIYNALGQEVVTLVDGLQEPGQHLVEWNGTDSEGIQVASGMYLYRMKAGFRMISRKMLLTR